MVCLPWGKHWPLPRREALLRDCRALRAPASPAGLPRDLRSSYTQGSFLQTFPWRPRHHLPFLHVGPCNDLKRSEAKCRERGHCRSHPWTRGEMPRQASQAAWAQQPSVPGQRRGRAVSSSPQGQGALPSGLRWESRPLHTALGSPEGA